MIKSIVLAGLLLLGVIVAPAGVNAYALTTDQPMHIMPLERFNLLANETHYMIQFSTDGVTIQSIIIPIGEVSSSNIPLTRSVLPSSDSDQGSNEDKSSGSGGNIGGSGSGEDGNNNGGGGSIKAKLTPLPRPGPGIPLKEPPQFQPAPPHDNNDDKGGPHDSHSNNNNDNDNNNNDKGNNGSSDGSSDKAD